MKFLTFNIVVAAALGYLFLSDKPEIRNHDVVAKLTASADAAWSKALDTVAVSKEILQEKAETALAPKAAKEAKVAVVKPAPMPLASAPLKAAKAPTPIAKPAMVRQAPAPKGQEVEVAAAPEIPARSAVQIDADKAASVARKDPAAARRRAEVLGEVTGEQEVAANEPAQPKFMTPRERRRELLRLAEDMELRFLDTVKQ
ncbi:MAG: hypothetical protein HOE62_04425 [Alphaproteobacteria bacterium]|jgi:hypothetical protein|nr:hypothetical protein [Alphaproteobacteria bacterium]MBT4017169.1 hypothetical protein [Alphaproteobacteria bacterium]MBT4966255.1 hypothetical protein [Alphaproteobacteria bacterium]MBT5159182.1 hypothetical protein [Alphaproteobacteria bacterium]MBT5917101.1 hypothetical protein [Alphaproteobacteria bacterium]